MTTFEIAQALFQYKGQHQIICSEKGYFFENGNRISKDRAIEVLNNFISKKPVTDYLENWAFNKLNAATQAFFYSLCEQMMEATKDASLLIGVKIGKDIPSIGLANAPRLTNLKKAGVFAHGGRGWLQLTERGRAIFLATI